MSPDKAPSSRSGGSNYMVGIMFTLMGGLIVAIATGLIHSDPSKIHAPTWVLVIFGLTFVLAGVWVIFQSAVGNRDDDSTVSGWVNFAFAMAVLLAITVICLWVGFGPGQRLFVQNIGIDAQTRPVDSASGRIFFGFFGVLMALMTAAMIVRRVRKFLGR